MRRRQIRDVTVKAMALTGAPANGERFLLWKSMDGEDGREGWPEDKLAKGGVGSGPNKDAADAPEDRAKDYSRSKAAAEKASARADKVGTNDAHAAAQGAHILAGKNADSQASIKQHNESAAYHRGKGFSVAKSLTYSQWLANKTGDDVANLNKGGPGSGPHKGGGSNAGKGDGGSPKRGSAEHHRDAAARHEEAAGKAKTLGSARAHQDKADAHTKAAEEADKKSKAATGEKEKAARSLSHRADTREASAGRAKTIGAANAQQAVADRLRGRSAKIKKATYSQWLANKTGDDVANLSKGGTGSGHHKGARKVKKSIDAEIGTETSDSATIETAPQELRMSDELSTPPEDVLKSIQEVALAKSSSPETAAALEALGHIIHANPGLTMEGIYEMGAALELSDLSKAKKDEDDEDEDGDDEDEGESPEDEDDEDDSKVPAFIKDKADARKKTKDSMKKSAHVPSNTEGEPMGAEKENLSKSHRELLEKHNELVTRLEKTEGELNAQRHAAIHKSIVAEVHGALGSLPGDADKLATVIKSLREKADQTEHDTLMEVLKAANAQINMTRQGGSSLFKANSRTSSINSSGMGSPMDRLNAMIDQRLTKGGETKERHQIFEEVVATPEGRALWAENAQGASN